MGTEDGHEGRELNKEYRLRQLYLAIVSRYKEHIEEHESLSIAELPSLVTVKNEKVIAKAQEIIDGFSTYDYDSDFYNASMRAFEFVKDSIDEVVLPVQFWLLPEETLSFMMGDLLDRNILLCALLVRLGNPSAKVFVKIKGSARDSFVYCEFNNKVYIMDISSGIREFDSKKAMLDSLGIDDETTAYEFNNQSYADVA
jgi:hypothetical protein